MSQRETRLAEAVGDAWYGAGHPGDDAYALGVVAALALMKPNADPRGPDTAKVLAAATDAEIAETLAQCWAAFWVARPELAFRCEPISGWIQDDPYDPGIVRGAAAVARACAKHNVWQLAGEPGCLPDEDLLGHVYTEMRPNRARQARGEFFTPQNLCYMMAKMMLGTPPLLEPGQSICEPAAGTGGMFLGAARALRDEGKDPADYWWVGNDVSSVLVACLAVNAHVWGLGRRVLFGVADSIADPDWQGKAWEDQRSVIAQRDAMMGSASLLAAVRAVEGLVSGEAPPLPAGVTAGPGAGLLGTWCAYCCHDGHDTEFCPNPKPARRRRAPARPGATAAGEEAPATLF